MYQKEQYNGFKKQLKEKYVALIEKSNNYRFEDETISDLAAFKAMKLLDKLNQINYLERKRTV